MAVRKWNQGSESITQAEHISPEKTGDNIEAKKVALYVWNPDAGDAGEWERDTGSAPGVTQYEDGANPSPVVGTVALGKSGFPFAGLHALQTDNAGKLNVNAAINGTLTVQGTDLDVRDLNQNSDNVKAMPPSYLDDNNNTTTSALTANSTYTGTATQVKEDGLREFGTGLVIVTASHNSAANGLQIQQSADGSTNWRTIASHTYTATTTATYTFNIYMRYCRIVYTNGGTNQTSFELNTLFYAGILPVTTPITGATDVSLASAATSAQLLAANLGRKGLLLTNTDANAVYLYYGTTATTSKFTVKIPTDGYWEMPQPIYTGRIDVIWAADGAGSLVGSEL